MMFVSLSSYVTHTKISSVLFKHTSDGLLINVPTPTSVQFCLNTLVSRGGNLLAPHDSIRCRFRGQRFDSKPFIDSKPIIDTKPIIDYQF